MKLVEVNLNPTDRQLRQFGLMGFLALPAVGWWWAAHPRTLTWLGGIGLVVAVLGYIWPRLLKPVFIGLMFVTLPVGMVIGELAMGLIYFGVFLPIGLCFKWMGRDALKRELDRDGESYWEEKKSPVDVSRYYRQW